MHGEEVPRPRSEEGKDGAVLRDMAGEAEVGVEQEVDDVDDGEVGDAEALRFEKAEAGGTPTEGGEEVKSGDDGDAVREEE